jgi:hypothetical protein
MAGAVASVAGSGFGSILTPLLAWQAGARPAVAAVSIPHLAGTALRCPRGKSSEKTARVLAGFAPRSAFT